MKAFLFQDLIVKILESSGEFFPSSRQNIDFMFSKDVESRVECKRPRY